MQATREAHVPGMQWRPMGWASSYKSFLIFVSKKRPRVAEANTPSTKSKSELGQLISCPMPYKKSSLADAPSSVAKRPGVVWVPFFSAYKDAIFVIYFDGLEFFSRFLKSCESL